MQLHLAMQQLLLPYMVATIVMISCHVCISEFPTGQAQYALQVHTHVPCKDAFSICGSNEECFYVHNLQ